MREKFAESGETTKRLSTFLTEVDESEDDDIEADPSQEIMNTYKCFFLHKIIQNV